MTAKLRIRHVAPEKLNPHPDNPRFIEDAEYEKLKNSLQTFGFVEPLIVNTTTGFMVGGHQRLKAARDLGIDEIPIVEITISEADERALNVALNNPELQGRFEIASLVDFLGPLEQTPTLERSGFDFDQWQALQLEVASERAKAGREGAVPPPTPAGKKTRTQPGDLWQLGRHTLTVGDASNPASYQPMPGPARMMFTDPPYNVDYQGGTADHLEILNDAFEGAVEYAGFLEATLGEAARHVQGAVYICHAISEAAAVHAAANRSQIHMSTTIAWIKDRFVLGRSDYHWQWEGIIYGWTTHGAKRFWIGDRNQGNVWEHDHPKRGDRGRKGPSDVWRYKRPSANRDHPTMKPVALVEHAIRNSSQPGDLILDPFAGSGSTMVAAENLDRPSHLIELDPRYADVIVARFESLETGYDPERRDHA